ncbi:uncharacterized protein N0V89_000994 [Didymosphaeria variabile]|uniref:R3H-associated N-terminal domain-containing protein n=1 Tax=Didymosphaeria variabile TaxID=1932322 RepID=A0A9W8XXU8_9PLEO|nr:uncharacterized protein N0V89_000994 [Didymosphaeria variabile]KAJ4360432.1 hypothetical protein N0V89_000994 [Didymosphaeria variabile]
MAILTTDQPPQPQPIDIEAWTVETATAAISQVTITTPGDIPGATVNLQIPLDDVSTSASSGERPTSTAAAKEGGYYKRKEPIRRDSLKRREALLKGKEGSRRRLRWENDRLLNNPYAEPPQPKDWEVHPTHPVHNVPYYLAPLWDAGLSRQETERKNTAAKAKASTRTVAHKPTTPGVIPKELREKMKRSRGAKGLLMDLEAEVRKFVEEWEIKERRAADDGLPADPDSSDDEIVFVGRNGKMSDLRSPIEETRIKRELMLFETPEDDQGGNFGRWLVHHIGVYYGLKTWSVTVGDPARREAYVGLKDFKMRTGRKIVGGPLPRPLWGLV